MITAVAAKMIAHLDMRTPVKVAWVNKNKLKYSHPVPICNEK